MPGRGYNYTEIFRFPLHWNEGGMTDGHLHNELAKAVEEVLGTVGFTWKDPVATFGALPATGNTDGDVRVTLDTHTLYVWTGSSWERGSGALTYKGTWDASTNTPALASGVGGTGDYYVVSVSGNTNLDGITDWVVGDWAIFNGTAWQKADHTDVVSSVFGRQGAVVATSGDYAHSQIGLVGEDDHHNRQHALDSASDHTGTITDAQHGSRSGGSLHPDATPNPSGVAGFMSAADKTLLDSLSGGIAKGTSFPTSPADGDHFYRTDLDALFHFDAGRAQWLGELEWEGGGRNGNLASNTYARRFNGMPYSATLGVLIPWDVTIVGFTWVMSAGVAGSWEVRRNGAVVSTIATGAASTGKDMTLNDNFASDGIFSIYWNSANACDDPQLRVYFRRRAT